MKWEKIFELLIEFNNDFDQIQVQILSRENLLLNEVFSSMRAEEGRRMEMVNDPTLEISSNDNFWILK